MDAGSGSICDRPRRCRPVRRRLVYYVLGAIKQVVAAEATIKIHRARVMTKMAAGSLADLVRMTDKLGLRNQVADDPGSTG